MRIKRAKDTIKQKGPTSAKAPASSGVGCHRVRFGCFIFFLQVCQRHVLSTGVVHLGRAELRSIITSLPSEPVSFISKCRRIAGLACANSRLDRDHPQMLGVRSICLILFLMYQAKIQFMVGYSRCRYTRVGRSVTEGENREGRAAPQSTRCDYPWSGTGPSDPDFTDLGDQKPHRSHFTTTQHLPLGMKPRRPRSQGLEKGPSAAPANRQKRKAPNEDGDAYSACKRPKTRAIRTIPSQPTETALSATGELDVASSVKARECEINSLEKSMQTSRHALTTTAFQQVP